MSTLKYGVVLLYSTLCSSHRKTGSRAKMGSGNGTESLQQVTNNSYRQMFLLIHVKIQVVPGLAGGGSFRRKKNYIAKREFAYRMCAR